MGMGGLDPGVPTREAIRPTPGGLIRFPARLQAGAFAASSGPDARYHALVHEGGSAAGKALLTTPYPDDEVARELRALGARDGGGVPMSAWTLRRVPLVPAPDRRVEGSPISVTVEWEGWPGPRDLSQLVEDPGGQGVDFRFGGNEEHDHEWDSGCIVCLFSCPGGVISNNRYSIRDHVREATRFAPASDLPPDGTEVTVGIGLVPRS